VRAMRGPQWQAFTDAAREAFVSTPFTVDAQSDRMGYRMRGEVLTLTQPLEMISEATAFGTVQVPPDGNPIVLMADRQSAGGYPKIAYVASVDLPLLAQALPGASLRFAIVEMEEAQALYLARAAELAALREQVRAAMAVPVATPDSGSVADAQE